MTFTQHQKKSNDDNLSLHLFLIGTLFSPFLFVWFFSGECFWKTCSNISFSSLLPTTIINYSSLIRIIRIGKFVYECLTLSLWRHFFDSITRQHYNKLLCNRDNGSRSIWSQVLSTIFFITKTWIWICIFHIWTPISYVSI